MTRAHPLLPLALAGALLAPVSAGAGELPWCVSPSGATALTQPQDRTSARVNAGEPLSIVAVGSSSTVGVGASAPELTYPSRLQAELQTRFPEVEIRVVNRGKSGEDAPEELARLGGDVVALHPDLAIWQVGTNAVLRRDNLDTDAGWMREGVALLKRNGIDVVLMDMQFAPRVVERAASPAMEALIADTAETMRVGLYRRFALMQYWERTHPTEAAAMIGPDGLHMTDTSYGCLAADLAGALASNWLAGEKLVRRPAGAGDAVAGLKGGALRRNDANRVEP